MALTTQAYGLVKNKNHFSQGPQALLLDYISFLNAVYTLSLINLKPLRESINGLTGPIS
jgi:hypothetical protein